MCKLSCYNSGTNFKSIEKKKVILNLVILKILKIKKKYLKKLLSHQNLYNYATTCVLHFTKIGTRSVHVGSLSEVRARHFKLRLCVAKHCDHVKHAAITLFRRLCSNCQCYLD